MDQRQKKLFSISLILPLLLGIYMLSCMQQNGGNGVIPKIDDDTRKIWEDSFRDYLNNRVFPSLEEIFDKGTLNDVLRKRIKKTVLHTSKYKKLKTPRQIKNYLKGKKDEGYIKLTFDIKCILVEPAEEIDEFNGIGYALWTYELSKPPGENGDIDIEDPIGGTEGRHHSGCVWDPEG